MHTPLFSPKSLQQHLASLPEPSQSALERAMEWKRMIDNRSVLAAKETELDGQFLSHFFRDVLGFSDNRSTGTWTLTKNQTSHADSSVPDGVLGFFAMQGSESVSRVHAVIELKDASHDLDKGQKRQNDKRTPVEQAFSYAPKAGGNCKWVIVSNYLELRLYHASDQSKYERFELSRLAEPNELRRLLFLMHRDNLLPLAENETTSRTEELFAARVKEEDRITKEFYAEYKQARNDLFKHLCAANPSAPELLVLNKTQKLLDRVIFVCFVEDKEIIPRRTFRRLLDDVKRDKFNRSDTKIWDRVRGLFAAINEGYPDEHINKFNGGLFADDADLDALSIKDSVLEHIIALEKYDFDSDLNVNILGHIFEQSITDIEEMKASLAGAAHDASKGKRKKDGIFYTPEYITRYMVQETVGGYLEERKAECGFEALPTITDTDWQSIKRDKRNVLTYNKTIERHIAAWTAYREKLAAVKVCDPACGSGAFLNQVFDFLYAEGQRVNTELARLQLGQTTTSDLQKDILQNNIYGVDVNPESVEITRLSLWLKTADRSKELTSLDHTIRCGNSLVDDPNVAGETAFDWAAAFPEVMQYGGFDVIVGNPPYVKLQNLKMAGAALIDFLVQKYFCAQAGNFDLYLPFVERGISLLNSSGLLGFIAPSMWIYSEYGKNLRALVSEQRLLAKFLDFGSFQIFEDATVYTACQFFSKRSQEAISFAKIASNDIDHAEWSLINYSSLSSDTWAFDSGDKLAIKVKMDGVGKALIELCDKIFVGIQTSADVVYHLEKCGHGRYFSEHLCEEVEIEDEIMKPLVTGTDVKRYAHPDVTKYLLFPYNTTSSGAELYSSNEMERLYPHAWKYLQANELFLRQREKGKFDDDAWYRFGRNQNLDKQQLSKIGVAQTVSRLQMFLDERGEFYFNNVRVNAIAMSEHFEAKCLLALLNSKAVDFYFRLIAKPKDNGFYEANKQFIAPLPLPLLTVNDQQPFITHAETMLNTTRTLADLRKRVLTLLLSKTGITKASTKLQEWDALTWAELEGEFKKAKVKLSLNDQEELLTYFEQKKAESERLKATLQATDRALDALVYELYGLTAEEIAVVEGGA